jgi:glycosyltransferase involved in cell wall biosynthesis
MKYKAIHQFHAGTAYGDAVTNAMFFTQGLLQDLGFQSKIYAEHIPRELASKVFRYDKYRPHSGQALLVHHSMGHDRTDWILANPDPKLLVYHNITPAKYFSKESAYGRYAEVGRRQLELFRPVMDGAICDSEFNAQELRLLGYDSPAVIPLLMDVEKILAAPWNAAIPQAQGEMFTVMFVGRINENKCQHHVIEVFRQLQRMMDRPAQLIFIGDTQSAGEYFKFLQQEANQSGDVHFLGKVPADDLYGWYRAADVFVCMSEHEGFGVPLIEAMIFDVPVIAFKSSCIPLTLGGAGLLVGEKRIPEIAALIKLLAEDRPFQRAVIRKQRKRVSDFHPSKITSLLVQTLQETGIDVPDRLGPQTLRLTNSNIEMPSFQVEGPFESSYSLAIVNREVAFALEKIIPGKVALFATEGPGDYQPDMKQIRMTPGLESLFARGRKNSGAEVVIRNLFPPRVADMDGLTKILSFAWEESAFPDEWVQSFNRHLDGVVVVSRFVKKVLIDAGVQVPIEVIGNGIDQVSRNERKKYQGNLGRGFRFLHISSGFPRKGVDVLLQSYTREFTSRDPVTLVIKTFPNPHNPIVELIRCCRAKNADCPDIVLINEDLPSAIIQDLYRQCHALVAPSRGEGFGLPMAEAMAIGIPVITTRAGGQADFCTDETAWLVDYRWEAARTHLSLSESVWAEPDVGHLSRIMREVYQVPREKYLEKLEKAKNLVQSRFTWGHCATRMVEAVRRLDRDKPLARKKIKLGWVTPWNTLSGIYAESKSWIDYLLRRSDLFQLRILANVTDRSLDLDGNNLIRCWKEKGDLIELKKVLAREAFEAIVLQFHPTLFLPSSFDDLIGWIQSQGVPTIVFLHGAQGMDSLGTRSFETIRPWLAHCQRLLVSSIAELNRLREWGLIENVTLFSSGVGEYPDRDASLIRSRLGIRGKPVLGTFGCLRPENGILELIQAFPAILAAHPHATLLLIIALDPELESKELNGQCQDLIDSLGIQDHVRFIHRFLDLDEAVCLLECADLLVYPYQNSMDSLDSSLKVGLASHRPVAVTPHASGFNTPDLSKICHLLPGMAASEIAEGINRLMQDIGFLESKNDAREKWVETHSCKVAGRRLDGMIQALVRETKAKKG